MSETTAITDTITTLLAAEQRFNLTSTEDPNFFTEWRQDLPELTPVDRTLLADL